MLEESTCSGTYLSDAVNRWSPYTRRSFGIPYRLGKGHVALQAYKHYCWPFLCISFPQERFQDLSCCCCTSWLVTHQETSEGWQAAPLPLHAPVPPGFPWEEGYLSCAGCHSTPCLYLGPRTEQEMDDVHSRWTLPLPELNTGKFFKRHSTLLNWQLPGWHQKVTVCILLMLRLLCSPRPVPWRVTLFYSIPLTPLTGGLGKVQKFEAL